MIKIIHIPLQTNSHSTPKIIHTLVHFFDGVWIILWRLKWSVICWKYSIANLVSLNIQCNLKKKKKLNNYFTFLSNWEETKNLKTKTKKHSRYQEKGVPSIHFRLYFLFLMTQQRKHSFYFSFFLSKPFLPLSSLSSN